MLAEPPEFAREISLKKSKYCYSILRYNKRTAQNGVLIFISQNERHKHRGLTFKNNYLVIPKTIHKTRE